MIGAGKAISLLAVYLLLQFIILMLVGVIAVAATWDVASTAPAILSGNIVLATIVVFLAKRLAGPLFSEPGLNGVGWCLPSTRVLGKSALAGVAIGVVVAAMVTQWPDSADPAMVELSDQVFFGSLPMLALWSVVVFAALPVCEELVFRGFLLGPCARNFGKTLGLAASSAAFLAIHLPQIHNFPVAIAGVIALGLAAGAARMYWQSLFASISLHISYTIVVASATRLAM